jgi:hypothetical protein
LPNRIHLACCHYYGQAPLHCAASAALYVNFFQPSFKLASKQRDGALVRKRYHPALAPYQRLLASERIDETVKQHLREQFAALDPVALLTTMRAAQQELSILTNRDAGVAGSPDQPEYLAAFATAWHSDYRAPKGRRKNTTKHSQILAAWLPPGSHAHPRHQVRRPL